VLNENKVLLKKMLEIDKQPQILNPNNIKHQGTPIYGSLNKNVRYNEMTQVISENKKFLDRLGKVRTH
jgi:hypothetical protein